MRPEDRAEALLFGALTGLLACATKEMSDVEKKTGTLRDLGVCAAGTGLSTITILTFDF